MCVCRGIGELENILFNWYLVVLLCVNLLVIEGIREVLTEPVYAFS